MNYFFFSIKDGISATLEIPKFQNCGKFAPNYQLFSADIEDNNWIIKVVDCEEDENFHYVKSCKDNEHSIYFLATLSEVGGKNVRVEKLLNYNEFSNTSPDYRANLCVSNLAGGFSSYQSEYPFNMTLRRGSIMSSISTLGNPEALNNTLFIRNVFCEPINAEYSGYLVCKKEKVVKKRYVLCSNETSIIKLNSEDFNPNHYFITKGFLGVPIYFSESSEGHLSFEHTHPPHSNIHGLNRYSHVARLKNELLKIVS